jgi:peroxiredoxin
VRVRNDTYTQTLVLRRRSRLLVRAVLVLLAVALLAELARVAVARDIVGTAAPDFALKDAAGHNVRLSEYRGDVVALTFTANWCSDCAGAARALATVRAAGGSEAPRVLTVAFDRAPAAPTADATLLLDPDGVVGALYAVQKLPAVVLIDREGQVRGVSQGFKGDDAQALEARLRGMLAE